MRRCSRCKVNEAEVYLSYSRQYLCKECFNQFFEKRVKKTVEKYKMFKAGKYVAVAVSGGKDSASLLYSLKQVFPDMKFVVIHVHSGINKYSDESMNNARQLAEMLDVEFHVYKLSEKDGFTIPDFIGTKYGKRICATCGLIRRWVLSYMARELGVDILATGHNLDDTVEVMLNLFLTGEFMQLKRLKPVLPPEHPSQVWKVKPLILTPELDNLMYATLNKLPVRKINCPYHRSARSTKMKDWIDIWERRNRNIKFQLYSVFSKKLIPILDSALPEEEYGTCKICGGPSMGDICSVCRRKQYILEVKQKL